jgi:hypothetical protein
MIGHDEGGEEWQASHPKVSWLQSPGEDEKLGSMPPLRSCKYAAGKE